MPRRLRFASTTGVYHWIVRGVNKKKLFHDAEDFEYFKDLTREYQEKYGIKIYHYCMMTNHVHKLLHADQLEDMSAYSHFVQRRYAYHSSKKYKITGSAFQRGYKSFPIHKDEYFFLPDQVREGQVREVRD